MNTPKKPLVNYVLHLNNWRARIKSDPRLKSGHISLYYALFHTWNERRFQNPINVYRDEVMNESRVGSRNNYAIYMRQLGEWGYIQYTSDSKSSLGSIVRMIPFDTAATMQADGQTQTEEQKDGQVIDQVIIQAGVQVIARTGIENGTGPDTGAETERPATPYYNINTINSVNENGANRHQAPTMNDLYWDERPNAGYTQSAVTQAHSAREGAGPRPQSVHEVIAFFREIGAPSVNARKFYHYHESNSWTIGKNRTPIVDWKARARYWTLSDGTNELQHRPGDSRITEGKNYSEPL